MATINTGAFQRNQPEAIQVGDNVALIRISLSVSVSIGDVHRIGKLPQGAIPVDAIFFPGSAMAANTNIIKFGTSASNDMFFASASFSTGTAVRCTRALGTAQQISISDDSMPRYEAITMVNTGVALSVGFMGDLVVFYKMPGQTLG